MAAATLSEAKRSKIDSEEQDDSAQKEALNAKKAVEYRANIAICETQMEELRYVQRLTCNGYRYSVSVHCRSIYNILILILCFLL